LVNYPIKIIKHPKNLGLSVARNTGIRESSGDIIAFFDSDIYIPKNYIEHLLEYYRLGLYDGIGGGEIPVFKDGFSSSFRAKHMKQSINTTMPLKNSVLFGLAMSFKREALYVAGGFDPKFRTNGEDVDICLRLINLGFSLLYVPSLFVFHYKKENFRSMIRTSFRYALYGNLAMYKNGKTKDKLVLNMPRDIPWKLNELLLIYPFIIASLAVSHFYYLSHRKKFVSMD
jgi:GT2 family glycosyltransferase